MQSLMGQTERQSVQPVQSLSTTSVMWETGSIVIDWYPASLQDLKEFFFVLKNEMKFRSTSVLKCTFKIGRK